ncbi:glutathione S-transferase zeta class-like isoform X3 [Hibiscus syriacus]|uniref:glutathione S-transferase zeta class-like isoform X3 n=1 Tax=Hibiscus syriacus TaxID=106335 RepID=UPI001923B195|nr:glutathione S-transferase zeta class-like isoform X3 [Hibiscus syriacus]
MAQQQNKLKLYSHWISSCSCRIRIVLNLKGLEYQYIPVNLRKGEHLSPDFQKLNPIGYVPVLVDCDDVISDSFAIFMNCIEEKVGPDEKIPWAKFHIEKGFGALEKLLKDHAGRYVTGDEVSMADAFLAPQIDAGIKRFNVDMARFPILTRLNEAYSVLPEFQKAMPENQPDAPTA